MSNNSKRIAILTLPLSINYGGILQAYSMQQYLRKQGYEAYHINFYYWNFVSLGRKIYLFTKRSFKKYILDDKNIIHVIEHNSEVQKSRARAANTGYFIDKYIDYVSLPKLSQKVWYKSKGFKAFIAGSDQVWRPEYTLGDFERYFFNFIHDDKIVKLSYAASFGVDKLLLSDKKRKRIAKSLKRFKAVSVREDDGINICKEEFQVEALCSIDPTMLLKPDEYLDLCKAESAVKKDGGLLVYVLDRSEDKQNSIAKVSRYLKLKPFMVNQTTKNDLGVEVYPSVTDWLQGYHDARFVITDSFHGCAFSILFNKPFIAIANKERGVSRFLTLLKTFGLEDRLIYAADEATEDLSQRKIDWDNVNSILDKKRTESADYFDFFLT